MHYVRLFLFLNPPEKQLVFEDTRLVIIDGETLDIVSKMRSRKRRSPRHGNPGLFSGEACCSDCGSSKRNRPP
ncbi:MAG: hypothetical protein LBL15_03830 [Oscillospiraceae bacterium]|nr:hypothetical protein [Oscillospiraceae bacterium]